MTVTTAPVQTTRSGRPKVPPLDTVGITEAVRLKVDAALAETEQGSTRAAHKLELETYRRDLAAWEAQIDANLAERKAIEANAKTPAAAAKALARVVDPPRPDTVLEDFGMWVDGRRLRVFADLLAEADETVAELEKMMYRLALSLHIYGLKQADGEFTGGARGVWRGIGVSRETFSRRHVAVALDTANWPDSPPAWTPAVAERGRAMRVRYFGNALADLPGLAAKVYEARAMQRLVRPQRDELMHKLAGLGMKRVDIAGIIGRNPSRVSHILTGRGR